MKKLATILFLALLFAGVNSNVNAQQVFTKGSSLVNIGIGGVDGFGINGSYDYGVFDPGVGTISLGGYASVVFDDSKTGLGIGARTTYRYHFNNTPFEVYGATMLGFRVRDSKTRFLGTALAGGRYMFNDRISIWTEMGWAESSTAINFGVAFAF